MKICNNCQTKNNDESVFCKKCGGKLKKDLNVTNIVLLVGVILVMFSSIFFGILNWENMNNIFRLLFFVFETCLFFLMSLALKRISNITSRIFFIIGLALTPFTLSMIPYYNLLPSILFNDALIFTYLAVIYLLTFILYKLINIKFNSRIVDYLALISLLITIIFAELIFDYSPAVMGLLITLYMIALNIISKIKKFGSNKSYYIFSIILSFLLTPFLAAIFTKTDLTSMIINGVTLALFISDGYIKMFKEKTIMHFFTPFMFQILSFVFVASLINFSDAGMFITLSLINVAFYYISLIFKNKLFSITTLVLTNIMFGFLTLVCLLNEDNIWLLVVNVLYLLFNLSLLIFKKYNYAHFFLTLNVLFIVLSLNDLLYNFETLVIIGFLLILYLIFYLILNLINNKFDFMYLIIILILGFITAFIQIETSFSIIKLIIAITLVIGYILINIFKEHISIRIIWFIILNTVLLGLFYNIYYSLLTISIFTILTSIILEKITKFNYRVYILYGEILVFIITLFNTMESNIYSLFINILAYILGYLGLIKYHNKKAWRIAYVMVGLLYITKLLGVVINPIVIASLIALLIILIIITLMYLLDTFKSKELIIISLVSLIPYYNLVNVLNTDLSELYLIPFVVYSIVLLFTIKFKSTAARNVFILIPFFTLATILLLCNTGVVSTIIDVLYAATYMMIALIKKFNLLLFFAIGLLIISILFQIFTVLNSMFAIISLLVIGFVLIFVAIIYSSVKKD